MSITLSKLCCDAASKYNMKLIAGKQGIDNTVRWVHMIEDQQVPEFLHGNELVFTTGIGHIGNAPLLNFVKKLKEYHAAGLVINIGPYLSEIPKEVIEYCNSTGFPIFTIPWNVYIIDITYDFCRRIINNEKTEATVSETFKSLIVSPEKRNETITALEFQGFSRVNFYTVLSVRFFNNGKNVTSRFSELYSVQLWNRLAKSGLPSAMFVMNERLVVIRQNTSKEFVSNIDDVLAQAMSKLSTTYVMGISSEARGFLNVPELLNQADSARLIAEIRKNRISFYEDIGINKLLLCAKDRPNFLNEFAEEYLHPVLEYDKEHNTDFTIIFKEYLRLDGSVQAVADKLGLHRNTVNGRIRQIKDLFPFELTGQKKMELLLAFAAKEIADYITLNGGN